MALISELMKCEPCGHLAGDLIERSQRDEFHECLGCGEKTAKRTQAVPHINTSDSATIMAPTKRFDGLRKQQMLKKEKAAARERLDTVTEKKINNEIKKVKESK
jgi:hypothetical protein